MRGEYQPTDQERLNIKAVTDKFKVSGDGVFATLQGEGSTAGEKAVFLRLHYCNLACGKDGGWACDTTYTWDKRKPEYWQEPFDLSIPEIAQIVANAWEEKFGDDPNNRIVITGGEPLLQQRKIAQLKPLLEGWKFEYETNGTVVPIPELSDDQFNCSPKLANSGNSLRRRYNPAALRTISTLPNSWFKFVVVSPQDFEEIDFIKEDCDLDPSRILIMPEGHTAEQVAQKSAIIAPEVERRNWRLVTRNHLIWFGPKRRT